MVPPEVCCGVRFFHGQVHRTASKSVAEPRHHRLGAPCGREARQTAIVEDSVKIVTVMRRMTQTITSENTSHDPHFLLELVAATKNSLLFLSVCQNLPLTRCWVHRAVTRENRSVKPATRDGARKAAFVEPRDEQPDQAA